MLFLALLGGVAYAQLPDACTQGEFLATGRFTGQNIDMNYDESALLTEGGATKLKVAFTVPRRYTETYEANAFAITFNRELEAVTAADQVTMTVGQVGVDQSACYSNRYGNYTYCKRDDDGLWTFAQNAENECITDASAVIPWADVMGTAFAGVEVKQNGIFTEVFLTATVETWTHFVETAGDDYKGQMTGSEGWLNKDITNGDTNRQGEYSSDAGWMGWPNDPDSGNFGVITMDDERYTLYQIPFILRFPRTVVVETTFQAASDITVLTAVLGQDTIEVNMNPGEDGNFAQLEAVITTQTQYPYAIRGPDDDPTGINAYVGDDVEGTNGNHAESIEFIEYDQQSSCGGQGLCTQTFKVRITPTATNRCSVAGNYFFEFWAKCQNGGEGGTNGCPIDDLAEDADLEMARTSNAYFSKTVKINHQPFCPVLMDEVRVVGDINVFHDESFTTNIASSGYDVFTNDFLFYEASYRTAAASLEKTDAEFHDNDFDNDVVGDDSIIDYVRSTKIFMDVTIGKGSDGSATAAWNGNNWNDNFDFAGDNTNPLGGTRIPGTDITGSDITVTNPSGDHAGYNILLCQVDPIPAAEIMFDKNKPDDCFSSKKTIALDFLDFDHVLISSAPETGDANNIDENEVAFKMRMDERIIPLKPLKTDGSHVTVTVEAEVYYKGNRHSTRRLLQADTSTQSQKHSMSTSHPVMKKSELAKCTVEENSGEWEVSLKLDYENEKDMPTVAGTMDWATRLSVQLDSFMKTRGAVTVTSVEKCNSKACNSMYRESKLNQRRRISKATHMNVNLKITSTKTTMGGVITNNLQDHLMNKQSGLYVKVNAFANADITDMAVEGCNKGVVKDTTHHDEIISSMMEDEESSAAAVSMIFASLVSFWMLF